MRYQNIVYVCHVHGSINLPSESEKIHTVRQHFHVDQHEGIVDPIGMLGSRLEVDVHVVYGQRTK